MENVTITIKPVDFGMIRALASITLQPFGIEIRGIRVAHGPGEEPWVDWPSREAGTVGKPIRFEFVRFPLMNDQMAMEQEIIRAYRKKTKEQ